jgi:hypothetical protein
MSWMLVALKKRGREVPPSPFSRRGVLMNEQFWMMRELQSKKF